MHDLLEKTHASAQPDPAFEQRMVSGVRRKIQTEQHRETAWESVIALGKGVKGFFTRKRKPMAPVWQFVVLLFIIVPILAGVALGPITNGTKQAKQNAELQAAHEKALADYQAQVDAGVPNPVMKSVKAMPDGTIVEYGDASAGASSLTDANGAVSVSRGTLVANGRAAAGTAGEVAMNSGDSVTYNEPATTTTPQGGTIRGLGLITPINAPLAPSAPDAVTLGNTVVTATKSLAGKDADEIVLKQEVAQSQMQVQALKAKSLAFNLEAASSTPASASPAPADTTAPAIDARKLIRNAQLDLEVKSYQAAMDQITAMTKAAGGYVDTSNSQKGGNGKLQGTVVVKVLPQNLDDFLLKLRDLGQVNNQSVSTDDVTKDYFDTQARLVNSQKMETQLQDLLKRENGKVSDLLQVERELGRVRGEIEQMQGQLKLYDFQVQYATITIQMREKDLNQAAAYLLKEQDDFSLFATDVEDTFQKARQTADDFKAQILLANLNHNSGSDVSAELEVMVAPDQIEPFLAEVRSLGRVANFTRQTQRVAKDGGDSDQPADQTLTEKDKVQVHLSIRSDDETRKQVALTVVAKAVDDALDRAKTVALANAGVEILSSSLNKTPGGASTAALTVRVPGKDYSTLIAAIEALGRTASLSIQRNDDSGPGANGDDAPVIVALSLTDDDTPLQETQMSILTTDVDNKAQQIKKDAAAAGVEVKASSFERQPDGTEVAQMTFRLPMAKYAAFVEGLNQLGKVESLTVHRDDRPDQTRTDDTAPAEISLQMHNQGEIVSDDNGLWATLRQTFGDGAGALFGSVRVIGVAIAFLTPWVFTLGLMAWVGRRIYIWRKR